MPLLQKSRRPIRQLRAIDMTYPLSHPGFTGCMIAKGKAAPFQLCQQGQTRSDRAAAKDGVAAQQEHLSNDRPLFPHADIGGATIR